MIRPMSTNNTRELAMAHFAETLSSSISTSREAAPSQSLTQGKRLDGSRTLAGMLLAAAMAALLVVADQVIDTWSDGHLLAGWVALWTVAFAALALLTTPLRKLAGYIAGSVTQYVADTRRAHVEARMWELANRDPRVMADLRVAKMRQAE